MTAQIRLIASFSAFDLDQSPARHSMMCYKKVITSVPAKEFSIPAKKPEGWIDDLTSRLGWHDRGKVYHALLASLHALRDALGRDEAVYLGAQLPPLRRGFYYEDWHPETHAIVRRRSTFLERIHDGVHREPGIDAEEVARALFAFLASRLPAAEVENAKAATPKTLHNLWPS